MITMTNNRHDGLFELPAGAGGEPFEQSDLRRRTDFQSRLASWCRLQGNGPQPTQGGGATIGISVADRC